MPDQPESTPHLRPAESEYQPSGGLFIPRDEENRPSPGFRITPTEILYIVFKHKWTIGVFAALGIVAALGFNYFQQPVYFSEAKLLIRYVQEDQGPVADLETGRPKSPDIRGETIINTEVQIITSLDLARRVATSLGPERLLGTAALEVGPGAGTGVVRRGLSVEAKSKSSVLNLRFENANRDIVQPVLQEVVDAYLKKHVEVHRTSGKYDEYLVRETDQRRARLANTEEELRKLKDQTGVLLIEDTKRQYTDQISRIRTEIMAAETALAEKRAVVQSMTGLTGPSQSAAQTPGAGTEVPAEKIREYKRAQSTLDALYRREQEYSLQFTSESIALTSVRRQIEDAENVIMRMQEEFPALASHTVLRVQPSQPGLAPTFDAAAELAQIKALETRVEILNRQLTAVRAEAAKVNEIEPRMTELQRQKEIQEEQYRDFAASLEKQHAKEALGAGGVSNISIVQAPSDATLEDGKVRQIMAGLALGGMIMGVALAILVELFLDRSVRRTHDIETTLGIPLFLAIPYFAQKAKPLLGGAALSLPSGSPGNKANGSAIAPWSININLRPFFEALRNRLVYNFEIRNLTHNPKLVAVTSCGEDSGVSTIAAGLAATLSELGEGNVLLVNMHPDSQVPYYFHKGDLKLSLDDALQHEKREEALVGDNLYVVSSSTGKDLNQILPKRFNHMIPKFRASDYDYIIFDLPPVSQISVTPQLVRHMDQVLMVVEAEKSSRDAVRRARDILGSSGAQIGVVLNKTRDYLPRSMQQDALLEA